MIDPPRVTGATSSDGRHMNWALISATLASDGNSKTSGRISGVPRVCACHANE